MTWLRIHLQAAWLLLWAGLAMAGPRLGGPVLTPTGAQRAANADGSIPAWTGGLYHPGAPDGQWLKDPFANEKPLYVIARANLDRYLQFLTPGQLARFRHWPKTFRMRVFPSHRTGAMPQWVYAGTRANAQNAKLVDNGNGIRGLHPGIPFPVPENGRQAIWNHLLRWRGTFIRRIESEGTVFNDGSRRLVSSRQEVAFPNYRRHPAAGQRRDVMLYYTSFVISPANMAGGGFLMIDTINSHRQSRLSWAYDAGQRRIRRVPDLEYDSPAMLGENLRTVDDTDMFNGPIDRYNWTLVGKQERLIPYNNYAVMDADPDRLLTPHFLNPDLVRWEKHRVWVVDADLKPGRHHIYPHRRFYIDEDSWSIVMVENYDRQGHLWRLSTAHPLDFYQMPLTFTVADTFLDLRNGRYNVTGLLINPQGPGLADLPIPADSYFQPALLRQRASR